ncbi:MAG: hypothetical protein NTW65_13440 [Deltaproteobacteria bacterium]|nr:hypothetical protein [Deltaproteobacteria bacterium]
MPVLHKYKGKNEFYALTRIEKEIVTFQLTKEGQKKLFDAGVIEGEPFLRALLLDLCRSGDAFTQGKGVKPSTLQFGEKQMSLDFSDDPEPESMFPSCGECSSLNDLHIVEMVSKKHIVSILCSECRKKKSAQLDTSIPLPLINRGNLKQLLTIKGIKEVDKSISSFQKLLDAEFESKWKALSSKKLKQKLLFNNDETKGPLL